MFVTSVGKFGEHARAFADDAYIAIKQILPYTSDHMSLSLSRATPFGLLLWIVACITS